MLGGRGNGAADRHGGLRGVEGREGLGELAAGDVEGDGAGSGNQVVAAT